MRALVTGGGGFIGSNLVEALLRRGADVRVLDNFATGRRENLAAAADWAAAGKGRFELFEADIRSPEAVDQALAGREVVFHLAALPSVSRSVEDPLTSHQVNVDGTLNLLLAARQQQVRRFVFTSSSSIYGESPTLPKVETMGPDPISPYGLDKLAGETYSRLFFRLYGLPTVALRYFNVFGPRQNPHSEYAAVIPKFVTLALAGGRPTIFGTGEQTRDFTHVNNVVEANLCAAEAPLEACGHAYNIACGDRISLLDLVAMIGRLTGRELQPVHAAARAGDIQHSLADVSKAARLLGYTPQMTLEEGLRRTVEYYRSLARG